jgi:hypothetical protein
MKVTRFLLSAALLLGFAGISHAQVTPVPEAGGTMQLSWDNCAPLVQNKNMLAGANVLFASVTNHSLPHQAYQVWLLIGDSNRQLPDAWRFDAAGCNGGFFSFAAQPPVALSKTCPGFVPAATQQFTIPVYQMAPPGLGYATTLGNAFLAVSYPTGSNNINPAVRYHLAGFTFDHTFSTPGPTPADLSTCGGFERGMCLVAIPDKCTWLNMQGEEFEFNGISSAFVTYNGGTAGGLCPGVIPAEQKTWGSIKDQYKR